ncbi:MAG: L-2-hydroxyglutarate oxidase [Saprospiraceae bacterium]|nr:L-2-hydroxyglutarate oxidase [Saprospiraceae bacterium]HMW38534.1 L-2-hydroxyglutarate oxidase [Saprospiraceae bacterium]HMX88580.1 L-2-hydroxyglutarate oxidase [Saprospiraceae bacterium]HMZ40638.1 L-2-hydroxyglutarate oxidase [Saprospiraceae bacterium]HNA63223.1 L-2-hydroxyglutarate oxidase [Saprospiraceae bacterium]
MRKEKVIIIGAGIVGLATAYQILRKHPGIDLTILEKESTICQHQSGHNSGVIHSGIYYKPGGLRATNCIRGYKMLIDFCNENGIQYDICGKIIVATRKQQLAALHNVYERGLANGLQNLKMLQPEEMKEIEPHVAGIKGIYVPQTGICDYRIISAKYLEHIYTLGGELQTNQKVQDIKVTSSGVDIITDRQTLSSSYLINCAGLFSDKLARMTNKKLGLQILPFRGEYYKIREERKYLVKNLIYPAPDPDFPWLGVHFTRMIDGGLEAGPNAVLAFRREGYKKLDINISELWETLRFPGFHKMASRFWRQGLEEYRRSFSKKLFTRSLQALVPEIREEDLVTGGAGVRALACSEDGSLIDDFVMLDNERIMNVCNAPSPAATSSLSIGLKISEWLDPKL